MTLPPPRYNFIYGRLVTQPNDIIGIIAYARYKQQKIEWIGKFKADHNGTDPTESDLEPFHTVTNTDTSINGYRLQAKEILDEFLSKSIEQATQEIEDTYSDTMQSHLQNIDARITAAIRPVLDNMKQAIRAEVKAETPGFWNGVTQNVIANFVILIITAVILLVLWSLKYGFLQTMGDAMGYDIKSKPDVTQSQSEGK